MQRLQQGGLKMAKLTPMMEQYFQIKNQYQDCILFFRLGDFYEMFYEDAITCNKELEIALTGKNCGQEERAPMCGVPFHSAESYISRLVEKGYKVAICEQVEDPKEAKGIVERDVIRIITPGTILDNIVLDEKKNNYLMCIYMQKEDYGVSIVDVTTGEFLVTQMNSSDNRVIDEIGHFMPAEIICNEEFFNSNLAENIKNRFNIFINVYFKWAFDYNTANKKLCQHFSVLSLDGFGLKGEKLAISSAGAILQYLLDTQRTNLSQIITISNYLTNQYMLLDISSRRNLELCETLREKSRKGSLLWVLDKTKTVLGARLIRKWIEQPLLDINQIQKRLNSVEEMKKNALLREEMKEYLSAISDIERLMTKIVYQTANAKDLISLKNSLKVFPFIQQLLKECSSEYFFEISQTFDVCEDICELIEASIIEEAPFSVREGGLIKSEYNEKIAKLRLAKDNGTEWLKQLEEEEKEKTQIKNLKIGYNRIFGYYIEVTKSNLNMIPERYTRRQTLANAERFITPELKELEETILGAEEKLVELEYNIFCDIRNVICQNVERIQKMAYNVAVIDVLQSFGEVADKENYTKPELLENGELNIVEGRHPVVEKMIDGFISNDTLLDIENNRLSIITGPNMAGKSTYMRQVALIVLMAQIGSFVPAKEAQISIVDRIFTRVGASDDLASGQSTFMVEMAEVANILNNATQNSLLILDEIGRGTSTFDGLSIAWAVLEYISDKKRIGAKTLFATHYHELTELEGKLDGVINYCIDVQEKDDNVIFLRKIKRGGANHSYGIQVAKLAGLPNEVIQRSKEILSQLGEADITRNVAELAEEKAEYNKNKTRKDKVKKEAEPEQLDLFSLNPYADVIEEIRKLNVMNLTPMQAMQFIMDLQQKI